jgi:hypothetical protein
MSHTTTTTTRNSTKDMKVTTPSPVPGRCLCMCVVAVLVIGTFDDDIYIDCFISHTYSITSSRAYIVLILDAIRRFLLFFSLSSTDMQDTVNRRLLRAAEALSSNHVDDLTYEFTCLLQLYDAQFVNDVVVSSDVVARTAAFRIAFDQAVEAVSKLQASRPLCGHNIVIPLEMECISDMTSAGRIDTSIMYSESTNTMTSSTASSTTLCSITMETGSNNIPDEATSDAGINNGDGAGDPSITTNNAMQGM